MHNIKKITSFLFLMLLIGLTSSAQELTCADFKIGEFYIPTTEELQKFKLIKNDSIENWSFKIDSIIKKTVIIRKEDTQTEWYNGIGKGEPFYEKIVWIDDCTYRLTFDETKSQLTDMQVLINKDNGIIVTKRKIEDNCLFYTSSMTINTGEVISQNGVICKKKIKDEIV